jgi:hypothetical protein
MKKTLALTALAATIIGGTLLSAPAAEARGCHHSWRHNYTSYNSGYAGYGNPYIGAYNPYIVNNSNYANPYLNAYGNVPLLQRLRLGLGF